MVPIRGHGIVGRNRWQRFAGRNIPGGTFVNTDHHPDHIHAPAFEFAKGSIGEVLAGIVGIA